MKFQLVTNLDNGAGLQHDFEMLAGLLRARGHEVRGVHIHHAAEMAGRADVNIFLEVVLPQLLNHARQNWLVPNSEWWGKRWDPCLSRFDRVLCKTQDAMRIWRGKVGQQRCIYTGWIAQDLYRPDIPKEPVFLHLVGKSLTKNTAAVIECWKRHKISAPLIVSAFKPEIAVLCKDVPNVSLISRFTPEELARQINRCQFFLMPSKYEGYGHAIHEALGCKAAVITTDGEPMRSFAGIPRELLVPVERTEQMSEATVSHISVDALAKIVNAVVDEYPGFDLAHIGDVARKGFELDNRFFLSMLDGALAL